MLNPISFGTDPFKLRMEDKSVSGRTSGWAIIAFNNSTQCSIKLLGERVIQSLMY
jgi:hypothetical protein